MEIEIPLADIMRFFHGAGPAMEFDDRNNKKRHYLCQNCDINYIRKGDINHCYNFQHNIL